jgi:hypothetical protein
MGAVIVVVGGVALFLLILLGLPRIVPEDFGNEETPVAVATALITPTIVATSSAVETQLATPTPLPTRRPTSKAHTDHEGARHPAACNA